MTRAFAAGVLCVLVQLTNCRNASTFGEALGVIDKPTPPRVAIDILCDPSAGSTCTVATLRRTVAHSLDVAVERPGSTVSVWMQGRDVATTSMAAEVTSPLRKRLGRRAKQRAAETWTASAAQTLLAASKPHLGKRYRRSPIAESITRVALAGRPVSMRRVLVIITDTLEVSKFGDWECGRLPKTERLLLNLHRAEVLPERSLTGMSVQFCHVELSPIDANRCPVSLQRAAAIETLWRTAIKAAGADAFEIRHGAVNLELNSQENKS